MVLARFTTKLNLPHFWDQSHNNKGIYGSFIPLFIMNLHVDLWVLLLLRSLFKNYMRVHLKLIRKYSFTHFNKKTHFTFLISVLNILLFFYRSTTDIKIYNFMYIIQIIHYLAHPSVSLY